MFYDWSECVMSELDTTKHSSCNCIDTLQQRCIVLYYEEEEEEEEEEE